METYNNSGQSFFEVVIAVGLISIVLVALVALGSLSIRASVFSRNQSQALRYTQQAAEWLRGEKDADWVMFKTHAGTSNWCLDSLYWLSPGNCSVNQVISSTVFTRSMKLTIINADTIQADIQTIWKDSQGIHTVPSSTIFTDHR